jgi:hypothetical protein
LTKPASLGNRNITELPEAPEAADVSNTFCDWSDSMQRKDCVQ